MLHFHSNTVRAAEDIESGDAANHFLASLVRLCFFNYTKLFLLISASVLMLIASMWLMLSPGIIYSKEMTWDLLFNLEGAWRLYTGQVLHVDFHNTLGTLPFAITVLGFQLVGIKPIAFIVGECVLAAGLTALAIVAVKDRLPILPGFLFVSMCTTLVLVPVTVGDDSSNLTFAMGYNRFGWSAVSILCLLLFIEPRRRADPMWIDLAAGFVLSVGLFYLKITYFAIAVAAISLALLTSRHICRHWPWWCGMLLLVILVAFAPMNNGYRADIISAIAYGRVHSNPFFLIRKFVFNSVEQIWVFAEIMVLFCLFKQRYATLTDVLFGLFILISGFFLLSQNAQAGVGIPLYAVLALLLYVRLGDWLQSATHRQLTLVLCLMTCALLPLLPPLSSNSLTLIEYNIKARQSSRAFVIKETNLQGLAVPADHDDVFDKVAAEQYTRDSFNRIRAGSHFEVSELEYVKTILGLADLLREEGDASARVVVIDQVSPLAFVLGTAPPRGGNLWATDLASRPPDEALGEADYVAIPRFPTRSGAVMEELEAYRAYLSTRFVRRWETAYWTVLERRSAP